MRSPLLLCLVTACASAPDLPDPTWNDTGSVWEHLASRYDANSDGRITLAEYARDEEAFARLDTDGDGALTRDDIPEEYALPVDLDALRARAMIVTYLQDRDSPDVLTMDELFLTAEAYDENGDELVVEAEFRAHAGTSWQAAALPAEVTMMGEHDPWEALRPIDEDGDGTLSFAELGAFFEAHDLDADFTWDLVEFAGEQRGDEPASGPRVGTAAPDFELAPPDGGTRVRLSSFRGEKPVALIFGSAT